MPDLQDDIQSARKTLLRLRDAFEQMAGTPGNPRSEKALQMLDTLREWEEEFGASALEKHAEEHEGELISEYGSASDTATE